MNRKIFACLVSLISGCAMTYDVVKVGPDTYQTSSVAAPLRGGIAGAQRLAITNANKKCDSMGKAITVTSVDTGHEYPYAGSSIVTFTCT